MGREEDGYVLAERNLPQLHEGFVWWRWSFDHVQRRMRDRTQTWPLSCVCGICYARGVCVWLSAFLGCKLFSHWRLMYSEIYGMISFNTGCLANLMENRCYYVRTTVIQLPYISKCMFYYLYIVEINGIFGLNYQIQEAGVLNLFQCNQEDGEHNTSQYLLQHSGGPRKLVCYGTDAKALFNQKSSTCR